MAALEKLEVDREWIELISEWSEFKHRPGAVKTMQEFKRRSGEYQRRAIALVAREVKKLGDIAEA
jgi:hypothetical protein